MRGPIKEEKSYKDYIIPISFILVGVAYSIYQIYTLVNTFTSGIEINALIVGLEVFTVILAVALILFGIIKLIPDEKLK